MSMFTITELEEQLVQMKHERDQAADATKKLMEGMPLGEVVGLHTIENMVRELERRGMKISALEDDIGFLKMELEQLRSKCCKGNSIVDDPWQGILDTRIQPKEQD